MPPKKETWKEELERALQERLDKWEERVCSKLGKGQSPVVRGFGVAGKESGVMLIIASTYNGGGTERGWAAKSEVYWHIAGASLHHIPGCQYCVSTADHLLADAIKWYRGQRDYWQMEVWAIPAAQFHVLHEDVKWSLNDLCEAGAVKVHGYFSLAEDKKLRLGGGRVRSGLDMAVVKLVGPMTGLSANANQPRVVTRAEARNMRDYVTENGALKVEITLEGRGKYICGDGQDTNTQKENKRQHKSKRQQKKEKKSRHKRQQKEDKSQEKKDNTSVMWTELGTVSWTSTTIAGMAPRDFEVGLQLPTWNLPLRYAGELRILEAFVPFGFGGGGACTILPARALNPNAHANDPDVSVLLGTCAAWEMFYDDVFPSTVIYGQRSCRTLSAMCFLFSCWLTDFKSWLIDLESWFTHLEGELKGDGDGDEDEDTHFWLTKIFMGIIFLTSIFLLDIRHYDVFSPEVGGGGGGDLEEKGIYKMLSTLCFFFSSLFTDFFFSLFGDFKKGIFKGGGGEDQDTRFGLIKFVISIILLDRRNDDVLLLEGQGLRDLEEEGISGQTSYRFLLVMYFFLSSVLTTLKEAVCKDVGDEYGGQDGGGGNLAEDGTHLTSVAFLTQEGLAEQMAGTYYRI